MNLNKSKNFIIAFFVFLAVYQTAELWFESFSNRNFFYTFLSKNDTNIVQANYNSSLKSIIISLGNNKFIQNYNDIYKSDYKKVFDQSIKECLENGSFTKKYDLDWKEILNNKFVMYKYDYIISANTAEHLYNVKSNLLSKIGDFDNIVLIPNISVPETLKILFINSVEKNVYEFESKKSENILNTYDTINKFKLKGDEIYYVSSVQNGFELFENNIFIPKWNGLSLGYNPIKTSNPIEENGGVLLTTLEKNIDIFFSNPAAKWKTSINNVYTYSDENTVVKYYTTGVLEYSNYKASNTSSIKKVSFNDNYLTSANFLENDININNEYYLKNYTIDNEKTIFYFDYKINNFPIILSNELKEKIGMESIIEITVSNQKVLKYKRYICDFEIDKENLLFADVDFLGAVNYAFSIEQNNSKINKLILGYKADTNTDSIGLNWFVDIDDKIYIKSAQY